MGPTEKPQEPPTEEEKLLMMKWGCSLEKLREQGRHDIQNRLVGEAFVESWVKAHGWRNNTDG